MATIASLKVNILGDSTALSASLKQATDKMQAFGDRATALGSKITSNVTLPLVAMGVAVSKLSMDFETSMVRIETLVGLSREQVQGMRDDVLALSGQTAKSPRELADALFVITSAGVRGAESLSILEQASKASAIGLGETADIARALTAVLQAYSGTGLTAAQATDQLIGTVREGNLEASSLAPALGRVIGIAANMGVTFGEVGANVATFTRLGVSAEQAITGLSGVLRAAMRPSEQAKKQFESMGLSASFLRESIQEKGLAQALVDLMVLFDGNTEGLGMVIPEIEALSNVLGVAGGQASEYLKVQESVVGSLGLLDDGIKRVSETAGFKFNKALTDLAVAGVKMGDTLVPIIENITRVVSGLAIKYNELSEGAKSFITILLSTGAVIGPVVYGVGLLTSGIRALTIAMLANPYTAIAIGILAIGTAAYMALSGTDDLNKKIRESAGLSEKLTGSQDEYNKILAEQNKIRNQIKPIDDQLAEGDLSPGQIQALMQTRAEYVKNQNAVKELGREWYRARDAGVALKKATKDEAEELGGTTTKLDAQAGSIGALSKELQGLQAQFEATASGTERAKFADKIRELEERITVLQSVLKPVITELKMLDEMGMAGDIGFAGEEFDSKYEGLPMVTEKMKLLANSIFFANQMAMEFTNSFSAGLANLLVHGGKIEHMLRNIGNLLASSALQLSIQMLLMGATGSGGLFGFIKRKFAKPVISAVPTSVMGGDIGTVTPASASLTLDGQFQIRGTDLVYVMNRAERSFR